MLLNKGGCCCVYLVLKLFINGRGNDGVYVYTGVGDFQRGHGCVGCRHEHRSYAD